MIEYCPMALRPVLPFALALAAVGAFVATTRPPASALVYRNDCPHEPPCAESVWVANQRLTTYGRLDDRSRRSFTIAKGQRIRFDSGVIVVDRPGRIVAKKADGRYGVGDTIYVLGYEGEGEYRGWHRDSALSLDFPFDDTVRFEVIEQTRFTWWAAIRDKSSRRGWLALKNVEEDGISFDEAIEMQPVRNRR